MTRRFSLLCLIAGVVLQSGCGQEPTRPVVPDVRIVVTPTPDVGGPTAPISIGVVTTNAGHTAVWRCSGWCCAGGGLEILDPDGIPVALRDPNEPPPLYPCGPPVFVRVRPTETLQGTHEFTGVLYQRDSNEWPSPTYAAPAGTYTVIASFVYRSSPSGESITQVGRATFVWQP